MHIALIANSGGEDRNPSSWHFETLSFKLVLSLASIDFPFKKSVGEKQIWAKFIGLRWVVKARWCPPFPAFAELRFYYERDISLSRVVKPSGSRSRSTTWGRRLLESSAAAPDAGFLGHWLASFYSHSQAADRFIWFHFLLALCPCAVRWLWVRPFVFQNITALCVQGPAPRSGGHRRSVVPVSWNAADSAEELRPWKSVLQRNWFRASEWVTICMFT